MEVSIFSQPLPESPSPLAFGKGIYGRMKFAARRSKYPLTNRRLFVQFRLYAKM
jgi:hypothetical protein